MNRSAGLLQIKATTLDGGQLDLGSLAVQDLALWFWAPWRPACVSEAPAVAEAHVTYGDDVRFIGMAGRSDTAAMEAFAADLGVTGFPHVVDPDGTIWAQFDVLSQPALAFIDDDGTITLHNGVIDPDALTNQFEELIAQ